MVYLVRKSKTIAYWTCNCCGEFDTRVCNGDNSICTECGSIDDFTADEE